MTQHDDIDFLEVIKYQPIITIGVIGSVSNGKSTLVANITGTRTQKHSDEQTRNITIRLGYANAKIYKCNTCCPPSCYQSTPSNIMEHKCKICNELTTLITHVSFADVPGHTEFMSTMLNGSCVMDYTILVESGANTEIQIQIPLSQSIEHYKITKEIGIENKLICLNKVDLISREKAQNMINILRDFFKNNIPIVPISGTLCCNIDVVCHYLSKLEHPKKIITDDFKMLVIRSFNVNHGGTEINDMLGGVIGGTLYRGIIKVGQEVVLYPGFIEKKINNLNNKDSSWTYKPLKCKVLSIKSEKNNLQYAIQGGLIALQLDIDPALSYDDKLVGQVLFNKDTKTIKIFEGLIIEYKKKFIEQELNKGETIQVNINSNNIQGEVIKISKRTGELFLKLNKPVCVEINDKVTINIFDIEHVIKLYGYGIVIDGLLL